ncbi:Gfo/Idh/MocA family protein [Pseudonocardia sp. CA-107938]|uniref:Gfo/Idh/MocA family protein n=1 Tax=Pseudonocardia sp. CA-107938 TaxID=3240021 RepID=UPI003D8C3648
MTISRGAPTEHPPPALRIGVVGASRTRGWASMAHLPALAALPGLTTSAVASTRIDGAREVAEQFGVPHAFGDPADLIACDEVDAVAITVKAPDHDALVRQAIAAGKHVFCEWPLGVDAAEADALAELAAASGLVHVVGLQGYHSPGAVFVRDLIDRGTIGEVMGVSAVVLTPHLYGPQSTGPMSYMLDPANGVTLITVPTAHLLAALARCVGDLADVDATLTVRHPKVTLTDTGEQVANSTPNELGIVGRLRSGALATLALHGGAPSGARRLSMQIVGTAGALLIGIDQLGAAVNVGDWTVTLAKPDGTSWQLEVPPPPDLPPGLPVPARNVAIMYAELARAVATGISPHLDFATAARYHHAVEAVGRAAASGRREQVDPYSEF